VLENNSLYHDGFFIHLLILPNLDFDNLLWKVVLTKKALEGYHLMVLFGEANIISVNK
jgi:hypothetical protein